MLKTKNFVLNHTTQNNFYNNLRGYLGCTVFEACRQKYKMTKNASEKSRLARNCSRRKMIYWR